MVKGTNIPARLDKKSPKSTIPNLLKSPLLTDKIQLIIIILISVLIKLGQIPLYFISKILFPTLIHLGNFTIHSFNTTQDTIKKSKEHLNFNLYIQKKALNEAHLL